ADGFRIHPQFRSDFVVAQFPIITQLDDFSARVAQPIKTLPDQTAGFRIEKQCVRAETRGGRIDRWVLTVASAMQREMKGVSAALGRVHFFSEIQGLVRRDPQKPCLEGTLCAK